MTESKDQAIHMAEHYAEHYERVAQSLIDLYGTGVRPGWVSADLAIAQGAATHYRKMVEDIKA